MISRSFLPFKILCSQRQRQLDIINSGTDLERKSRLLLVQAISP